MPNMANITAKNAADTDVVFTGVVGASGDSSALWKAQSLGSSPALQPELTVSSRLNANRNARKVIGTLMIPYVVTDGGVAKVAARAPFNFNYTLPLVVPTNDAADYAAYIATLIGSALVEEILATGYSAT